ncbi:ABC transporter ATP-binding protein [Clostridium septicum]|uniref:ABC transporter ATP-binding protein n=1 Tax=Clostridium septicum TaxID=1504 RepID=A0A9N7JL32_CLOSE|nr:ABC transporter ATP-binding protein [Clostridium septicum]AYE34678.1 ABC transporter ATP-binding protein [Clostridium septicum]QAS60079.1 ABC transporter ATP-binding protein [Clostridium septicum]UEC20678.1 ABC transporter ATP-binding protein [Clostridium septicum]USS01271.1 ABC transporter ATP-binding protein [Clostridium septicum]WLF69833.1 ABC transporter ATP-binding protein [Clostridium septicum]
MDFIKLVNISKVYENDFTALNNINLTINKGEFIALMGPSGSGKSTLLNIIGCLDSSTTGTYILDGNDCTNKKFNKLCDVRNKKIAFIFQNFALIKELNVIENILLPLEYRNNYDKKEVLEKLEKYLIKLGLDEIKYKKVKKLSGGQQQRVAIARALMQGSDLILADEPTGSLDEENGKIIMKILNSLNEDEKKTIIVVTHNLEVAKYCNKIITLRDGMIL